MSNIIDMKDTIEQSFIQYAGAVLQSRAFVDVRDCLKPSARQLFYCLYNDGFVYNKPIQKTLMAIGSIAKVYIHGDASAEGILMRATQNFALRYPLAELEGNNGSLNKGTDWAATRYTSFRLDKIASKLFEDIHKDTIDDWRDNYANTMQYPAILPSKGFYNIVNGTTGIGIGASSSIPQFNIKDVNKALETLLLNPDCSFEEIYCPPDFATGAYLINEDEVKTALKYGSKKKAKESDEDGASCKLRAVIEYDKKENVLIVKEIPYSVYTKTIDKQLEDILENEELNPGIDKFNDLTGQTPNIKIYLKKDANPDKVLKFLYKNTYLQYHYSINMTMLDNGRFPKVFTWKEALQAHINHEKIVYRRGFEYDIKKIESRIHIIDGLLICIANIEDVVRLIKSSESNAEASEKLKNTYNLSDAQIKAVLDMKLSRLAHLEIDKLTKEKNELIEKKNGIELILSNKDLFNQELIKGWKEIAKLLGDEHRTKIIKVEKEKDEEKEIEDIKPENVVVIMTKDGAIKKIPTANFKVQNRNGKGVKNEDETILDIISTNTIDHLCLFSNKGKMYKMLVDNIPTGTNVSKGINVNAFLTLEAGEKIIAITSLYRKTNAEYAVFFTKKGLIKKTKLEEYTKIKKTTGTIAIKINEDDSIANITFLKDEDVLLVTKLGMTIYTNTYDINPIGRACAGVTGIKLNEGDEVLIGLPVHKASDYLTLFTKDGNAKRITLLDLSIQKRGGKGVAVFKNNTIVSAMMTDDNDNILIVGKPNSICVTAKSITVQTKIASGVKVIKDSQILGAVKYG